jgi:predicted ATPase/DNA-binding winged helix-turn-helix (wHTH) protein
MDENRAFAFGHFVLIPERRELRGDTGVVRVGSRALDILITLVTRHPEIVSKNELLSAVWPNRTVEENNLTVHMAALRRALGDGRDGTRFVETLHNRGYCFVAPITTTDAMPEPEPASIAWAPTASPPANRLPRPASPFIGRASELAEISRQLAAHRLVTVTGTGGIGKTRIALQLGEDLASRYSDGVYLAELATITNPNTVIAAIAAAFYPGGGEASSLERLIGFIGNREMLLILDNCEHLIGAVSALAQALVGACPRLTMLATSRESLSTEAENVYRLQPFAVPGSTRAIDAADAMRYDAVRLFVARAAAATCDFVLNDRTAPEIARICTRLDGIALAIEMAAPRLQVLNPAQLADRLNERFRLLASQKRDTTPRHRTLRAVFDWSHDLLSEAERALLRRLATFAGGANFEAVVALAAEDLSDEWELLDVLEALINKSLVISDLSGREPRYRMLETTRQYALEKLDKNEEYQRRAHAAHFAHVFERAEAEWPTTSTSAWLEAYGSDADNLRAALDWAFGPDGDIELGLRLVAHSYPLWWDLPQLPLHESRYWFDLAVSRIAPQTPPHISARLWFGKSWRDVRFGDRENFPAAAQAVALFRQVRDPIGLGAALWRAGSTLLSTDTADEAARLLDEAERILRTEKPSKWLALTMVKQGDARFRLDKLASALAAYEEAMRLTRMTGHWYGLMNGGSNMAQLLFHLGQRDRALAQLREIQAELLPGRSTPLVATLAAHLLIAGESAEAHDALREAVTFARAIGLRGALGWAAEVLALMLAEKGETTQAARLAGYARAVHPSVATRTGSYRTVFDRLDEVLTERLAAPVRERLLAEGAAWSDQQAGEAAAAAF